MSAPKSDQEADVWDDLAQGELSREEEAVLRALAEEGEEAAVHYEAFAPLGDDFRARVTDKLAADLQAEQHRKQRRRFAGAAGLLAAAAAVLLFALPNESKLAPYSVEVSGGVAEMRGSEAQVGPVRFDAQSKLVFVAKPPRPVEGKVTASVAMLTEQSAQSVPFTQEQAKSGALRIAIQGADLAGAGPNPTLAVIVERTALEAEEIARLSREGDPRVLRVPLERVK